MMRFETTKPLVLVLAALTLSSCAAHAGLEPEGAVSTEYLRNTCAEGTTVRGIDLFIDFRAGGLVRGLK